MVFAVLEPLILDRYLLVFFNKSNNLIRFYFFLFYV